MLTTPCLPLKGKEIPPIKRAGLYKFSVGGMVFWSDIFMIRSGYLGYKMIFEALFLTMNVSFS